MGFAATTLFSLSSCKSNYEYVTNPDTGIISLEGSLSYDDLEDCKVLHYKDVYGFRKERYTAEDIKQIIEFVEEHKSKEIKEEVTKVLVKQ